MTEETIVHVVDDDEAVRGALSRLLRSVGYGIRSHATASEFLKVVLPDAPGCIVLDVRMPGVSGLELQEHLNKSDVSLPLVRSASRCPTSNFSLSSEWPLVSLCG